MVQKGVYPCYIRINFVRSWQAEILRREIAVFDNNAFVTAWVTILTLEAASVKNGPAPTDEQLFLALEALGTYHDRNSLRMMGVWYSGLFHLHPLFTSALFPLLPFPFPPSSLSFSSKSHLFFVLAPPPIYVRNIFG